MLLRRLSFVVCTLILALASRSVVGQVLPSGTLASALHLSWSRVQSRGTIASVMRQLDPFTTGYVIDGWPQLKGHNPTNLSVPIPGPGSALNATLSRKLLNMCDVAGDVLPWIYPLNASGIGFPTGAIGDALTATVQELGSLYNTQLQINWTIITEEYADSLNMSSSDVCFKLLVDGQVDYLSPFFSLGGLYDRQRRNLVFQRSGIVQTDIGFMQVLASTGIKSMTALQLSVDDFSKVCTNGAGSRQVLQSLFPQIPADNVVDYAEIPELLSALEDGTCLAVFAAPITANATAFPSNTLEVAVGFTRREKPFDASSFRGNEQLALAYEAALSEAAFSGSRRIALASVPSITFQSDCNLNPVVFNYPTPSDTGTLHNVLTTGNVTIGQLAFDTESPLLPWYGGANGGAVHRFLTSVFGTMGVFYNVLRPISISYRNYSSVDALFAALQAGEIDMTAPYLSGGAILNTSYDIFTLRQGCSAAVVPYLWYRVRSGAAIPSNTSDDLLQISSLATDGSIHIAIHEQGSADLLKSANPYFAAYRFTIYSSVSEAINATISGDVDLAFLPSNTVPGASSLFSFIAKIYIPCVPFFRKDISEPRPLFDRLRYVAWSDASAIVMLTLTALCVVATLVLFAVLLYFRSSPVVKLSPPMFLLISLTGLLLGFAMVFTYIGKLKNISCALRPWFGGLGFALTFSPMIAKQYRLARILTNTALVSTSIPMPILLGITGGLVGAELLLLIIWTAVSSARLQSDIHVRSNREAMIVCTSANQWIFIGLQIAYIVVVLLCGAVLSFIIRKVVGRVLYKEMQWINYAIYNAILWFALFCLISGLLWEKYLGFFVTSILIILLFTVTTAGILAVPKLYILLLVKGGRDSATMSATGSEFASDFRPEATEFS